MAYDASKDILIGSYPIDPESKFDVKLAGKKIDVRNWYLPEDGTQFAAGKGARFPKELGPGIALSILKACAEDLAANPKVAAQIAELLANKEAAV